MTQHAIENARAWFSNICDMLEPRYQYAAETEGWTGPHKDQYNATYFKDETDGQTFSCASWKELCEQFDIDADMNSGTIQESVLSVRVRGPWCYPGETWPPSEYEILLTTGGPALRIIGDLDDYCEPIDAKLQWRDLGTPWTNLHMSELPCSASEADAILLSFVGHFFFGG